MSSSRALKEIQECISTIQLVTGCEPQLFRPPFGVTSPNTANAIHQSGLETVAWDLRTFDTVSRADNSLVERTLGKLEHSSIVLLHDTAPGVIPATKAIIERARERGTILVRL
jgi:peptidoglycan/xylan/chitin deacetylase (PgdA/CDA1 family)